MQDFGREVVLKGLPWGQEVSQQELWGRHVWDRWVECEEVKFSRRGYMKESHGKEV